MLLLSDDDDFEIISVDLGLGFVRYEAFASPCILLELLIRFSKESAWRVYMTNPAEETTIPAIMNIAIVLSFTSSVGVSATAPTFVASFALSRVTIFITVEVFIITDVALRIYYFVLLILRLHVYYFITVPYEPATRW